MWGASRWTARFLLLVMLAPAFGPLAMAQCAQPAAMRCCMRQSVQSAPPAMPCHHAMAQPSRSESSETSLQATNNGNCCQNHCCCGATTSEWAQPASNLLSGLSLPSEPARPKQGAALYARDIPGDDSARAPPRP